VFIDRLIEIVALPNIQISGAGTNLKVGHKAKRRKKFLWCPTAPPLFWFYNYNISRFGERFRGGR